MKFKFEKWRKLQISFLGYLLLLFVGLFVVLGMLIVGVEYFANKEINVRSSIETLSNLNKIAASKVDSFLESMNVSLRSGITLISSIPISQQNAALLQQNLIKVLESNKDIVAAYVGDVEGDFYMVQRISENQFATIDIHRLSQNPSMIESVINRYGQVIKARDYAVLQYDPRSRPWYKKALSEKKPSWTDIYRFQAFTDVPSALGITLSYPFYNSNGELVAVFALDMSLNSLAASLSDIKIGDSGVIFLVDSNKSIKRLVLSENVKKSSKFLLAKDNEINDLNLPWAEEAFKKFTGGKYVNFLYKFNNEQNVASIMPLYNGLSNWYVVTVKSLNSMLTRYFLYGKIVIFICMLLLLLGILIIIFLALSLSRPFKKVLREINDIRVLKFKEKGEEAREQIQSHIKEINELYYTIDLIEGGFKSFARYVPPALIQNIMNTGAVATVFGESREITTVFVDIHGFATIAENMQPRELMFYLSEYFEGITSVIDSKFGTLDKYIGDGIMAFWGAPFDDRNHALHACQCSIMMLETLDRLNKNWKSKGLPEISLRIGVNSGYAVVGNVGSQSRLSYTAMGDSVNIASRLQELNKYYDTAILIGEDTYRAVSDQFLLKMVDVVEVRGKKSSIRIYELLHREKCKFSITELKEFNEHFYHIFNFYRVGDWSKALEGFENLLKDNPEDRVLQVFVERCKLLRENPPKTEWTGAWNYDVNWKH